MPSVPKYSQLRPGVGVNIVLKADQPTGKLTSGQISEILTRGDHPRGIKVRLRNGQIGRVQSLTSQDRDAGNTSTSAEGNEVGYSETLETRRGGPRLQEEGRRRTYTMQEDYREESIPTQSINLGDYIKVSQKKKPRRKVQPVDAPSTLERDPGVEEGMSLEPASIQGKLESEFPNVDSALVAAILSDFHGDIEEARVVFRSLA